ncbi:hypothetical protein HB912_10745 [Listeria aquatica]|uniref:Uncharacterized protein n=1 Tax=Listeria aquatica TaxID=1494960 RepID=A0A841ZRU2_9LIST|nr:hypothetical protein [Listeria aquatica]MBC1522124.1 hypothetical protein [Listeria aquatica]
MKVKSYENKVIEDDMEVDYYVPVTVSFPENDDKHNLGELYYYRFINEHESFIEVKINSITQKIVEVVFTSINDIEDSNFSIEEYEEKNPVIETDIFSENTIVTKEADFNIFRGNKNLYFKLNEENLDSIIKMSKHLSLFLNVENKIIGMGFSDFSEEEWSEINDSIKG